MNTSVSRSWIVTLHNKGYGFIGYGRMYGSTYIMVTDEILVKGENESISTMYEMFKEDIVRINKNDFCVENESGSKEYVVCLQVKGLLQHLKNIS